LSGDSIPVTIATELGFSSPKVHSKQNKVKGKPTEEEKESSKDPGAWKD
jgi:hypothetical protein